MRPERMFVCGTCGKPNVTRDPRKMFCDKKCADRSRSKTHNPLPTEITRFSRMDDEQKRAILLGEAGYSVAMFDIEATHLKPNVGRILCTSIKPIGQEVYTLHGLQREFKKPDVYDDGALAVAVRTELEKYDIIVGWNSKNFDVKFINSRCLRVGEPIKRAQYHVDGMWSWRSKMNAWSGLDSVQKFVLPENGTVKTSVAWDQWMRAIGWDPKLSKQAMEEIVDHCDRDVVVLEDVYRKVVNAGVIRSIRKDGGVL